MEHETYVELQVEAGVGTIRLQRAPLNVLNREMQQQCVAAAREADERDDVRAVIIYGGERSFAAGADIKEMLALSHEEMERDQSHVLQGFTSALAAISKPTVAAITGHALGGGCEIALTADVRFAAENAKIGQPEILLGIIPGAGGTQRLARLVGPSIAKDLIFTGRTLSAQEAHRIGLVNEVYPAGEVYERAFAWASSFAHGPRRALAAAKRSVDLGSEVPLVDGIEIERQEFAALFGTDDREIGMTAFIEKRAPEFTGD